MSRTSSRSDSHSRMNSDSFRIPINLASPPIPSSHSNRRSNPNNDYKDSTYLERIMTWLGGRVGRGGGVLFRPWLRRWIVVLVVLAVLIITLSRKEVSSLGSKWRGKVEDWKIDTVPKVDRATLEKLRLLDLNRGTEEEWEDDNSMLKSTELEEIDKEDSIPPVKDIPDVLKVDPLAPTIRLPKTPTDILDAEVCPEQKGKPCAFLAIGFIGEQETKAQLHLHQLGLLALALNRTLVLPNVAKSRMGSCYTSPFSFYYSEDSLSSLGIPTISHENFLNWIERRELAPSAQMVSVTGPNPQYAEGASEIDSLADPTTVPKKTTRKFCFKSPRTKLDFSQYSPIALYPPEGYHRNIQGTNNFGDSLITTLSSEKVTLQSQRMEGKKRFISPNVLVFNYELRYPILTPSLITALNPNLNSISELLHFSHFPYAETWSNISLQIAQAIAPSIAIHWRTETLLSGNLVTCAHSLINKLTSIHSQYPSIETVYLATDYPLQEIFPVPTTPSKSSSSSSNARPVIPHSGTFRAITPLHHIAFKTFLLEFEKLRRESGNKLRLTTFEVEVGKLNLPDLIRNQLINTPATTTSTSSKTKEDELDSGLIGIIDKGVALEASIFLTGLSTIGGTNSNSCGKSSSFTRQISGMREDRRKLESEEEEGMGGEIEVEGEEERGKGERGKLWNDVTYWSVDGTGEEIQVRGGRLDKN